MAGTITVSSEVIWSFDQPLSEIMLPEPVDDDASGKRMLRIDQPLRQARSWMRDAGWQFGSISRDQNAQSSRAHLWPLSLPVSSLQDMNLGPIGWVVDGAGDGGGLRRQLAFELLDFVS